jgi:hypothetical protein
MRMRTNIIALQGKLNHGRRLWGETLDMARKPSVAQNRAAVAAGAAKPAPAAAAAAAGGADCAPDSDEHCVASEGVGVSDGSSHSLTRVSGPAHQEEDWLSAGETWLVLSYCDKGCLQVCVVRATVLAPSMSHGGVCPCMCWSQRSSTRGCALPGSRLPQWSAHTGRH